MTRDILTATAVMGFAAALLYSVAAWRNPAVMIPGTVNGTKGFLAILPLLIISFAISGLVRAWVPREAVTRWLGAQSGLIGCLFGAVAPGGSYVSFPIVAATYKAGASISTVVAFVSAWSLRAVARLPLELSLVGPEVTLKRCAATLVFPPLAGIVARALFE